MPFTELQIKIISLADEAKTIRRKEKEAKAAKNYCTLASLTSHRKEAVRPEARWALLAYGFLRGRPYWVMERACHTKPLWNTVERLAKSFCNCDWLERVEGFDTWLKEAKATYALGQEYLEGKRQRRDAQKRELVDISITTESTNIPA